MSVLALPSTREEAWRWFDSDALAAAAAAPRAAAPADPAALFLPGRPAGAPRLLFVDGAFDAARSTPGPVQVAPLALATDHALGARAGRGGGWSLHVAADHAGELIEIVHVASGGENQLAAQIVLADDAAASIVETFAGSAGWSNRLSQARLGRAARLTRAVRLVQAEGFVSWRDEAVLGAAASYVATVLGAGGAASRIDAAITLEGSAGFAEFGGALLTRGTQRQEAAVAVRHAAPDGSSRQLWRAVAANRSQASLAARVEVARDAQKTDGEQSLRGLLLDRTATVNLKPELEIFADDVKCAHGATVGELDRNALFYLQSRGVPRGRAEALLTRAFVADALGRAGDDAVRAALVADADAWLERAL